MSRLTNIHKNQKHELAEHTDFILRLHFKKEHDVPIKTDCINLAIQYVALYQAMELRLHQLINEDTLYLNIFNKEPWVDRSEQLKNDIREMRTYLADNEKKCLLTDEIKFPAVNKMIDKIAKADPITLFACFSVRCCADVSSEQVLNTYNQRVFGNNKLKGEFYRDLSQQAMPLGQFIDQAVLTADEEKQFCDTTDDFFQLHIDLFKEMEAARVLPKKNEIVSQCSNHKSSCRYAMFALSALGLAVVAAGTAYCNIVSQK